MAKKSYDWVAIKIQFINSSLTIPEFSEKYDIPLGTLKKQVAQGSWMNERSQVGAETVRKSAEVSSDIRAYQLTDLEHECVDIAKKALGKLNMMLDSADKPNQVAVISSALVNLQKVYRLALGASTDNQAVGSSEDFAEWLKDSERNN